MNSSCVLNHNAVAGTLFGPIDMSLKVALVNIWMLL